MPTLLFLCDSNAARSPLAEAVARELCWKHRLDLEIWSAGTTPSHVRPEVRTVLHEGNYSADGLRSKGIMQVPLDEVSEVITLCLPSQAPMLPRRLSPTSWPLPYPSSAPASERLEAFRATLDELERRLDRLLRAKAEEARERRRAPWERQG